MAEGQAFTEANRQAFEYVDDNANLQQHYQAIFLTRLNQRTLLEIRF